MTATPKIMASWRPISVDDAVIAYFRLGLAANEQAGRGQIVTLSKSTGYAQLNDGTVPNQICAGNADYSQLSDTSAIAGAAEVRVVQKFCHGLTNSAVSNDTFVQTDFGQVAWVADENSIGKLSHTGADGTLANRSLGGLFFGLMSIDATPIAWVGPLAWLIARAVHVCDNLVAAAKSQALTTGTTIAEQVMPRVGGKVHGRITGVRGLSSVAVTTGDTNYWTFSFYKRSSTTPGTAVKIAEATTKTTGGIGAITAFDDFAIALVGTGAQLDLLETDIITVVCTAATGSSTAFADIAWEVSMAVG
jgi:hypothetical protein